MSSGNPSSNPPVKPTPPPKPRVATPMDKETSAEMSKMMITKAKEMEELDSVCSCVCSCVCVCVYVRDFMPRYAYIHTCFCVCICSVIAPVMRTYIYAHMHT